MPDLGGKVALVTGGARGQGRAHAVTLARYGCDVAACDIAAPIGTVPYPLATTGDLDETARQVRALGRRCLTRVADVRSPSDMAAAVAATLDAFGRLDIVVANAGICTIGQIAVLDDEQWRDMIDTNLTGTFHTVRAALGPMIERRSGRIIATSSMAGRMGMPNLGHYVAAKWGVIGLIKSVALEVATLGITANVVCPATVDTDMVHNPSMYELFCPDMREPSRSDVEPVYRRMNPMREPWLDPTDVAEAVAFLASDEARSISGSTMEVSLGGSAHLH